MKAGFFEVCLATCVAAAAFAEVLHPFLALVHDWWFALVCSIAGVYLLVSGAGAAFARKGNRFAAAASLGAALLAATIALAAFVGGQPQRIPAAPGQTYRTSPASAVSITFPPVDTRSGIAIIWPGAVSIDDGAHEIRAQAGDVVRVGAFVLRVDSGPIAYVDATSPSGRPVTVTQPDGAAFLSPFLTFGNLDGDRPEDYFAVPALHRNVQVDYWPGLPSRGIDIPFLALRIAEENGGTLYEGVAVSGRALAKAGMRLEFALGTYPSVTASTAPPLAPFGAGIAAFAIGWLGYVAGLALRSGEPRLAGRKRHSDGG